MFTSGIGFGLFVLLMSSHLTPKGRFSIKNVICSEFVLQPMFYLLCILLSRTVAEYTILFKRRFRHSIGYFKYFRVRAKTVK